jgi:hypothetical protein
MPTSTQGSVTIGGTMICWGSTDPLSPDPTGGPQVDARGLLAFLHPFKEEPTVLVSVNPLDPPGTSGHGYIVYSLTTTESKVDIVARATPGGPNAADQVVVSYVAFGTPK